MRTLLLLLALSPLALASTHRTHIVDTDDDGSRFELVRESDGDSWASFERDGVRYMTRDASVLAKLDNAMKAHTDLGRAHAELGRKHAELGREHAALGRQYSRARTDEERESLEAQQEKLEQRQQKLEDEQHELERKQEAAGRESRRAIERIFNDAVRDGKAHRD